MTLVSQENRSKKLQNFTPYAFPKDRGTVQEHVQHAKMAFPMRAWNGRDATRVQDAISEREKKSRPKMKFSERPKIRFGHEGMMEGRA